MFKQGLTLWFEASSLSNTCKFYQNILQFELVMFDEESDMLIFKLPTKDCEIGFNTAQNIVANSTSTVLEVNNIEDAVKELESRGLNFTSEINVIPDFVKLIDFVDPDGHKLSLAQTL